MYKYDVYYEGEWLHEDGEFETQENAYDDAQCYIEGKIADWEVDSVEYDEKEFYIRVEEE